MPTTTIIIVFLALLTPVAVYAQDTNLELIEAATNGHTETVQTLLEAGVDVDAKDEGGMTPLMWAAVGGHATTVKVLLTAGADVSVEDNQGTTARLWSANSEIRQLLKDPVSRLIEAATNGQTETVQELLEAGIDVRGKGEEGVSALMYAANRGHSDIVRALIHAGADVNAKDKQGKTAQMWTSKSSIVTLLENFQDHANAPAVVLDLQEANKNNPLPKAHTPRVRMMENTEERPSQVRISWEEYSLPVLSYLVYRGARYNANEFGGSRDFTLLTVTEDTEVLIDLGNLSLSARNARAIALRDLYRIVAVTTKGNSRPSNEGGGSGISRKNPYDAKSNPLDTSR